MGKPCNNTLYFVFCSTYLKSKPGNPHFLLLESVQKAKMKLSAKFKKILYN